MKNLWLLCLSMGLYTNVFCSYESSRCRKTQTNSERLESTYNNVPYLSLEELHASLENSMNIIELCSHQRDSTHVREKACIVADYVRKEIAVRSNKDTFYESKQPQIVVGKNQPKKYLIF